MHISLTSLSIQARKKMAREALTPEETVLMKSEGYGAGDGDHSKSASEDGSGSVGVEQKEP